MVLRLVTAKERRASPKTSLAIFGSYSSGKTRQLLTLPVNETVCVDIEAGLKSVDAVAWDGASIPVGNWGDFQALCALIGGPDTAVAADRWYSSAHYEHVCKTYSGTPVEEYARSKPIVFVDSITDAMRLAMTHSAQQPEAFSERSGKPDSRGAYGLMAREVIAALKHLQRAPGKTVIFVGLLEKETDDVGRSAWVPQLEGSKTGRELPGIVDEVLCLMTFSRDREGNLVLDEKGEERRFVCKRTNPWGLPAKDRSGRLDMTEPPDLGALLQKINHFKNGE
jgi:hypothetical protein